MIVFESPITGGPSWVNEAWRLEWKGIRGYFRYWNWGDEWARHPKWNHVYIHKKSRTWAWEE